MLKDDFTSTLDCIKEEDVRSLTSIYNTFYLETMKKFHEINQDLINNLSEKSTLLRKVYNEILSLYAETDNYADNSQDFFNIFKSFREEFQTVLQENRKEQEILEKRNRKDKEVRIYYETLFCNNFFRMLYWTQVYRKQLCFHQTHMYL
jgi:hypothetical protein